MIKLKKSSAYSYTARGNYTIAYDHQAGFKNRYRVLLNTNGDSLVIGRELDLKTVRLVIADYEKEFFVISARYKKYK